MSTIVILRSSNTHPVTWSHESNVNLRETSMSAFIDMFDLRSCARTGGASLCLWVDGSHSKRIRLNFSEASMHTPLSDVLQAAGQQFDHVALFEVDQRVANVSPREHWQRGLAYSECVARLNNPHLKDWEIAMEYESMASAIQCQLVSCPCAVCHEEGYAERLPFVSLHARCCSCVVFQKFCDCRLTTHIPRYQTSPAAAGIY